MQTILIKLISMLVPVVLGYFLKKTGFFGPTDYRILAKINALGLNILKLESRPIPDREFEFMFYFDIEAPCLSPKLPQLIAELENECEQFKYLGTYTEIF